MSDAEKDPVKSSRDDMAERISVAGWKEAFAEKVPWIRRVYQVILIVFSGCAIYILYQTIKHWCLSGYKDDVTDFADLLSIPFSNVTVCGQLYFNQTFIRHNLTIPQSLLDHYRRVTNQSIDDFYEQLTLFLSFMMNPKPFTTTQITLFAKVVHGNPQMADFSAFAKAAMLPCENVIRKCSFGGEVFDCCKNVVQSLDPVGICFLLPLNFDYDNAIPSNRTYQQNIAGPHGGLTLELSVPLDDFPWLDDDASNGYTVFVNPVAYSIAQEPLAAPHGAETFIKVTPSKHALTTKCAPPGHLSLKKDGFFNISAYDPGGLACVLQTGGPGFFQWVNCLPVIFDQRPNESMACSPATVYTATTIISAQVTENAFGAIATESVGASSSRVHEAIKAIEETMHSIASDKTCCLPHCQYWTYSSTASFFYRENKRIDTTNTMYSKINIYYTDFSYRQYDQVKETTVDLAICDFSNVVGLYWGMSMVSFFHVLYYVPRYVFMRIRWRNRKTTVEEIVFTGQRLKRSPT